jgi:hypothetical protein
MRSIVAVIVVMLVLAAGSQVVFAQQAPGSGPGPAMQEGQGKQKTPETFSERKARVQKMLEERKTRLEQEKICVDAAKTDEELVKCRPQRPMMHEGGGMGGGHMEGPGHQHPPMGAPGDMR